MKRIIAIIRFDITNALRDSMVIYILAAPILLAVALGFVTAAVAGTGAGFAVDVSTPGGLDLAVRLAEYGTVDAFADRTAVEQRVSAADDVAGFTWNVDGPVIVLQGNEGPQAATLAGAVLASALDGPQAEYRTSVRVEARSAFADYSRVALAMLSLLIGGVAAAFALVEEKESKLTRAFAVAPLSDTEYFAARGLWAAVVGVGGAVVAHLITGATDPPWWYFAGALAAAVFMPLTICLLIGGLAANQIQAVATLKLVMFAYLALPIGSLFVPQQWRFFFWPLPNYWLFEAFRGAYIPGVDGFARSLVLTFVTGGVLVSILGISLRSRVSPGRNNPAQASV